MGDLEGGVRERRVGRIWEDSSWDQIRLEAVTSPYANAARALSILPLMSTDTGDVSSLNSDDTSVEPSLRVISRRWRWVEGE